MNSATVTVVEVEDLRKKYGLLNAVDGISFSVNRGEAFGILGPNGAGKTTTVEILEGIRTSDSGQARIAGINVSHNPRLVKSLIGVQLQSSHFFDNLSLEEVLTVFASIYGESIDSRSLLRTVSLEDKGDSRYEQLSGGQRQRFSIAVALVNNPVVLFLDEPTSGLDPQSRHHIWDLIKTFKRDGVTVLLTTHYMEEAETLCDRVAIMDHGKIIALDKPDNLIKSLLESGFKKERTERLANLEDVFLELTGNVLREE